MDGSNYPRKGARMAERGRTEEERGPGLTTVLDPSVAEGARVRPYRVDLDPHRKISSILDHLN
jgi:hypothetical protein